MRTALAAIGLVVTTMTAPPVARALDLLRTVHLDGDEDTRFSTFLGKGVLMIGSGRWDAKVHVYDARSGALETVLACPPGDPGDVLVRDEVCPVAVAASGRLLVMTTYYFIHVFHRDGTFLRTIGRPHGIPMGYPPFSGGLAVHGRRILVGGPAYEEGRLAPGGVAYLYDGVTGTLLRRYASPAPEAQLDVWVTFAGRSVMIGMPGCCDESPGHVSAFDASSGSLLWSRTAREPRPGDRFGAQLASLRSDVLVGAGTHLLDGRTGELKQTYVTPPVDSHGPPLEAIAAYRSRVAVASYRAGAVHLFATSTGTLLETIKAPFETCDVFGTGVVMDASLLVATSGSYCGEGWAFVFRRH